VIVTPMALSFTPCVLREFTAGRPALLANHDASKWCSSPYRKQLSKKDFEPAGAAGRVLPRFTILARKQWHAFAGGSIRRSELNLKTIATIV
jgi:hypothetical protein